MRTYVRMRKGPRKIFDWPAMQAYIDAGNGYVACHKRFGIAHATWTKAIALGDITVDTTGKPYMDARKRYDWVAVQALYNTGASYRKCRAHFGFTAASWTKAVKAGRIQPRRMKVWTAEEALANSKARSTIKRHLLRAGIITNRCDLCGLSDWRGKPLSIQIDHVNGIRDDHRLENLRMLCPNCHSQTETFAARNNRKRRHSRVAQLVAAPDSESGGRSFEPNLGSHGPIV
jgi:5-methylcytosine-specific restriction endonuclease McrA